MTNPSGEHRWRVRQGFTLVELLVVIGIIAVLISILLPALSKAKQAALNAQCLSNLRQTGVGFVAYAEDHAGWLPPYSQKGTDPVGTTVPSGAFTKAYQRYWLVTSWWVEGEYAAMPRDGDGFLAGCLATGAGKVRNVMGCPAMEDGWAMLTRMGSTENVHVYYMQSFVLNHWGVTNMRNEPDLKGRSIRRTSIKNWAEMIVFCDGPGVMTTVAPPDKNIDWKQNTYNAPAGRHNGRFNAVFLDGHADGGTHEELYVNKFWMAEPPASVP